MHLGMTAALVPAALTLSMVSPSLVPGGGWFTASPAFGAASGSDGPSGTVSVGVSDGGSVSGVTGGQSGGGGVRGGTPSAQGATGGGGSWTCTYTSLVLNDEGGFAPGGPTPGGWYSVTCIESQTGASTTKTEWISTQAPPAAAPAAATPAVDPRTVALEAEASLQLPPPSLHFNPSGTSVVNLPTWLWVGASIWHTYSVTASVGSVSATAVATPRSVNWTLGDGGVMACAGPGRPFDPLQPVAEQSTSCSYTYRTSSVGQPSPNGNPDDASFDVRAVVTWSVSWSAQGAPGQGVLPALTTDAAVPVRVEQVESIESGPYGLSSLVAPTTTRTGPWSVGRFAAEDAERIST
jgi:hypothetical protein